jgi:hypothetical protein
MSVQPDSDKQLARTSGKLAGNGARLLVAAIVLDIIGAVLLIASVTDRGGLLFIGLSLPLWLGAIALLVSGGAGKRYSKGKDWA